jgi:hypothetical protein
MFTQDDQINLEFSRYVDQCVATLHLSRDWKVLGLTNAAMALFGSDLEDIRGKALDTIVEENGFQAQINTAVEDGRLANDRVITRHPFKNLMKPVADEVGLCVSWIWLVNPKNLHLTRTLATLRKLDDGNYGLLLSPLEDPTHRCFTSINAAGEVVDDFGANLTGPEIELLDLFMSGYSYEQIAQALNMTAPMAKRRTNKIAEKMNLPSPAKMREAIWNKHSEEFLISPSTLVTGVGEALY